MLKKIYLTFASLIAVITALVLGGPPTIAAAPAGHQQHTSAAHVRRRAAKAKKRVMRRRDVYVCPMHPDMRAHSRGECAKCGMDLVAEPKKGKPAGERKEAAPPPPTDRHPTQP